MHPFVRNRTLAIALLICSLFVLLKAADTDAPLQVANEIDRLQQSLKDSPIANPDFPDIDKMISGSLADAGRALKDGRFYLSLERLAQSTDLLRGAQTASGKADAVKHDGMTAFEKEWRQISVELQALDEKVRARDWSHTRAGVRALSEAAQGKAIPLLEGGQGFAVANGPKDGLFYMGQARGEAEFSTFAYSLNLSREKTAVAVRSLLPELEGLQQKTNAAFQPPKSIDLHPRFIALNSTIKLALELDSAKAYAGSLYEYLEALRHYGMLETPPPDAAKQEQIKAGIAAAQKQIEASRRDDSIAQIFVERAQSHTSPHADGSAPSADEWRSAQIIVEQVLPAYYAALKPAGPARRTQGITTTVTLVRWPYT